MNSPEPTARAARRPAVLDDVSRALVEMLQRDGRQSYAALAAAVGLSESTVRQRVQRLVDAGVIQVVAVTAGGLVLGLRVVLAGGLDLLHRVGRHRPAGA